jgi:hypothetical protein
MHLHIWTLKILTQYQNSDNKGHLQHINILFINVSLLHMSCLKSDIIIWHSWEGELIYTLSLHYISAYSLLSGSNQENI